MRLCWLFIALVLVAAPTAQAAGWKRVTTEDQSSIDQPGLVRTADGVLHLAWSRATGPNTEDLHHTAIARNGRLGATSTIASGWTGFANAALVLDRAGLRAFVGGIRSTTPGEPNDELSTLSSSDGGATWALQLGNVVPDGGQAYGSPVAAATRPSGETLQTWAGTLGTWVHAGLTPATPNFDYQAPHGQYGYDPNIAVDAGDNAMLGWYSSAPGGRGVLAQGVGPSGAPVDSTMTMPGTGNMNIGMLGLTPLVARPGGGFYMAYPVGRSVRVWRVGSRAAPAVARVARTSPAVTLAAAGDGRLWLAWVAETTRGPRVLAARSDRSVTRFGAAVNAGRLAGLTAGVQAQQQRGRWEPRRARKLQHRDRVAHGDLSPPAPAGADASRHAGPAAARRPAGRSLHGDRRRCAGVRRASSHRTALRAHRTERDRHAATAGAGGDSSRHEARVHAGHPGSASRPVTPLAA